MRRRESILPNQPVAKQFVFDRSLAVAARNLLIVPLLSATAQSVLRFSATRIKVDSHQSTTLLLAAFLILFVVPPKPLLGQAADWQEQAEEAFAHSDFDEVSRLANAALQAKESGLAHEWLGRVALARGQHEPAIMHFEAAREQGRPVAPFAESWYRALRKRGRREESCRVLAAAVGAEPSNQGLQYLAGSCHLEQGKTHDALLHLEQAYESGLRHNAVVLKLARARMGAGQDDRGLDLLYPLIEKSTSLNLLLEVGKLLFEKVLYRQSADVLRKAWELEPSSYEVGMYLALSYYLLEKHAQSADVLEQMESEPAPAEYRYLLGSVYARTGQVEKARQQLETGMQESPDRADGYLNLGLFYLEQGNRDKAMELLEKGSSRLRPGAKIFYSVKSKLNCSGLVPPSLEKEGDVARGRFYSNLANMLLKGQHWGSALEVYLLALDVDPKTPDAYGGIGLTCQELGTPRIGLEFVKQGVDLHPDDPQLRYYLGSLYEFVSLPDEAIKSYQTALRLHGPDSPALYWVRLGLAQAASGNPADGESSFLAALERNSESADAHYQLGKLYLAQRKYDLAEKNLEAAVRLDPSLHEAFYSYGLACVRNGKPEKGRQMLSSYQRKKALRDSQVRGQGMSAESPDLPKMKP